MLPWFAAYDNVNYTRWGVGFLADMHLLPQSAPEVFQGLQDGDLLTMETPNKTRFPITKLLSVSTELAKQQEAW